MTKKQKADREYYRLHRKKIIANVNRWVALNPDKVRANKRRWADKNKERLRPHKAALARKYRRENGERCRALYRKQYWAHVEKRRAEMRAYQKRTRQGARWRREHPERWAEQNRAHVKRWQKQNPEKHRDQQRRMKHRRRATGDISAADWQRVLTKYGHRCVYCGADDRLEIDHKIPVARGGTNDFENLQVACRSCNGQKWKRTHQEFLAVLRSHGQGRLIGNLR